VGGKQKTTLFMGLEKGKEEEAKETKRKEAKGKKEAKVKK